MKHPHRHTLTLVAWPPRLVCCLIPVMSCLSKYSVVQKCFPFVPNGRDHRTGWWTTAPPVLGVLGARPGSGAGVVSCPLYLSLKMSTTHLARWPHGVDGEWSVVNSQSTVNTSRPKTRLAPPKPKEGGARRRGRVEGARGNNGTATANLTARRCVVCRLRHRRHQRAQQLCTVHARNSSK